MTKEFFLDKEKGEEGRKKDAYAHLHLKASNGAGNERLSTFITRPSPMDISFLSTSALHAEQTLILFQTKSILHLPFSFSFHHSIFSFLHQFFLRFRFLFFQQCASIFTCFTTFSTNMHTNVTKASRLITSLP